MRLIDADVLEKMISESDDIDLDVILAFLDLVPTAYDVDKVVEESSEAE